MNSGAGDTGGSAAGSPTGAGSGASVDFVREVYLRVIESTVEASRSEFERTGSDASTLAAMDELRLRWQRNLLAAQDIEETVNSGNEHPTNAFVLPQNPVRVPEMGMHESNRSDPVVLPGIASLGSGAFPPPQQILRPAPLPHISQLGQPGSLPSIDSLKPRMDPRRQS
eukprot:CAMPEP_0182449922 /NCGR_PEP_ID=MMETSP1172-20130603/37603_1 /TAXON_ID=708627 /ORGANISM="Timspurckia oligopyrenoides, Strain CCMP3278" /LENGTH=168 /DNA_ID=CAMNT_0024647345 /DNA_START=824 /DNA_END=1330 /DNA_ORIENTATION=+